jgi:hypothetical protein
MTGCSAGTVKREEFLKYAVENVSGGKMYIPSLMTIGITSTISGAIVLVILIAGTYNVCRLNSFMWHDILTKFHEDW